MNPIRPSLLFAPLLALATLLAAPVARANADAQALLVASDAIRNPSQPFKVTVTLTEFEKGQQVDSTTLASYARTMESGGQFATLVRFVEPARDAGKLMLKIEDEQRRIAHEQRMGQLKGEIAQLNELNSKLDALLCSSSTSSTPPQSIHDNSEA